MPDVTPPVRWQPDRSPVAAERWPKPPLLVAMGRGARGLCPNCGQAKAFRGFIRVVDQCAACEAPLGLIRADDAPPYFVVFVVAHVVIAGLFAVDQAYAPPFWLQAAIWLPATALLAVGLLRPVKGATLGLMLCMNMMKPADE